MMVARSRLAPALARYGMAAARTAYANRRGIYRAATTVQRAFRTARRNRAMQRRRRPVQNVRARIGNPVGRDTSRRTQVWQTLPSSQRFDRTLYAYDCCNIEQGTAPNQRTRDILNFRGVKICMDILNTTDPDRPVFFNWAMISPKSNTFIDKAQWFRSNADNRITSFDDPNLTSMDYHCRSINTDAFNVITHKRHILAPRTSGGQYTGKTNLRVMRYVKISRQVRYNSFEIPNSDPKEFVEKCTTPIFFCYWVCREGYGGETEPVDSVVVDLRLVSYFRNPRE